MSTITVLLRGVLLLMLIGLSCELSAQQYIYTQYKAANGLAGNIVYSIQQDQEGFLWFGTETGVSRFDGGTFRNFTTADGLPDNTIFRVIVDSKGRKWFIPFKHTVAYYYKGKIYNQENDAMLKQLSITGIIDTILEDDQHNIIIATRCELYLISPDNKVTDLSGAAALKGFIQRVGLDEKKRLHVFVPDNILRFDGSLFHEKENRKCNNVIQLDIRQDTTIWRTYNSFHINAANFKFDYQIPSLNNYQLLNDSLVYINTSKGCLLLNYKTSQIEKTYFPDKNISSCFRDYEGNLWFSTLNDGIFRLHDENFKCIRHLPDMTPLKVHTLYQDGANLLIGTDNACLKLDLHNLRLTKEIPVSVDWPISFIHRFKKNIVIANREILIQYMNDGRVISRDYVSAIKKVAVRNANDLIIASSFGLELKSNLDLNFYQAIYYGRTTTVYADQDTVYFGAITGAYKLVNDSLLTNLSEHQPSLKDRITAICKDKNNVLWIGSGGSGISGLKNDKIVWHVDASNGLSSNTCRSIAADNDSSIWVGTDNGLDHISIKDHQVHVTNFTTSDGLISSFINDILVKGDTVFVGTPEGLIYFDKTKTKFLSHCDLRLLNVYSNDQPLPPGQLTRLPYGNNQIRIDFTAVSLKAEGDITYHYRLKGLDSSWKTTRQNQLSYISLSPGDYLLELYAINKFGIRSQVLHLPIKIHPRFWQTGWFTGLLVLAAMLLTGAAVALRNRYYNKKHTAKRQMEQRLHDLEQKALRAQMNPHFIFNSLHAIQEYIIDRDIISANQYLSRFAKLIRQTLDNSRQTMIPISDEIAYLTNYLNLEQLRFEEQFLYSFQIDDNLAPRHTYIPSMMLQPYVENAIRHGIQNKEDGQGTISIAFKKTAEYIICTVTDNGIGRSAAQALKTSQHIEYQSRGMQLTEERIHLLGNSMDAEIDINITDMVDTNHNICGTKVTVRLPLILSQKH